MRLRGCYEPFLKHIREYYDVLFPVITPLQIDQGGPVILMQVENEYGYYGDDTAYLETMRDYMVQRGVTVPLVTSDGPMDESLSCGHLEGALPTGNFGSRTKERFEVLKRYTDGGPLMCTEFWVGWFDHWGNGGHMRGNLEESVQDLDDMLELGHVNIYMFEGGTNFGFMNGSNYYDELTPDVTSYDYDAVLTEDGQITEKYRRYQEVVRKHAPVPEVKLTTDIRRKAYGKLVCEAKTGLFEALSDLSEPVKNTFPICMEKLDQNYGYILYRTKLEREQNLEKIRLWGANDRANIFVEGKPVATLYDRELLSEAEVKVEFAGRPAQMDILMENMGRVNFGPKMESQRKGIDGCVQLNGHMHYNWEMYPLPLDDVSKLDFTKGYEEGLPAFYRFTFEAEECCDTWLDFAGWGKGCAFLNGFNLGRYWEIGPQKRLYIPGPLLKKGATRSSCLRRTERPLERSRLQMSRISVKKEESPPRQEKNPPQAGRPGRSLWPEILPERTVRIEFPISGKNKYRECVRDGGSGRPVTRCPVMLFVPRPAHSSRRPCVQGRFFVYWSGKDGRRADDNSCSL